jgi:hypothetical protein
MSQKRPDVTAYLWHEHEATSKTRQRMTMRSQPRAASAVKMKSLCEMTDAERDLRRQQQDNLTAVTT